MNSESLKFWTTLIANLGVILGLMFLVPEIRQNSAVNENHRFARWNELGQYGAVLSAH